MVLPEVDQFAPLGEIFSTALEKFRPQRAAILGCATGNGIGAVDFEKIEKLYALDINPDFIEILKKRYSKDISKIQPITCDLDADDPKLSNIDMIYAALIFEYVDPEALMEKIARWLSPEGFLVAVLQLPCKDIPEISPSPFRSLEKLSSIMNLVKPEEICALAIEQGMRLVDYDLVKLRSGKEFCSFSMKMVNKVVSFGESGG